MRCRIRALVVFTSMIAAMSLCAAVMVRAQAPAGPNRPPQVPEEYIVTPFGYFHPSCVVHLAEGEELLKGGQVQKADGTIYTVPVCQYPHYTARGEMFAAGSPIKPPSITHSWIVSGSEVITGEFGKLLANWNVPSAPQSYDDQVVYFFPGLEDENNDVSILQPVLGWNADFRRAWGIASWNCCPGGTADESTPVHVSTGDVIAGTVEMTCHVGTLNCPTWNITTEDQTTGGSTTLRNTPSEGQYFNWAFGGVLEVYSLVQCSDYPPNNYLTFSPTAYNTGFAQIDPMWQVTEYASGMTPQCDYGAQFSPDDVTLTFGSFTLTVSPTGNGVVTSNDRNINCPGTCMYNYQADSQVMLSAQPAQGWGFAGWSGACTGMGWNGCSVTMTQDQSVTATFAPLYTLTISISGPGSVTSTDGYINCPFGMCSHPYLANTPVTLNASPYEGWSVSSWGGLPCSGNGPCTVTMSQNQTVNVTFTQNHYTLTASMSGSGTITSTDGFINCPGTCSHTYLSLTAVTLNAAPAQGWSFSGWSGACNGVGPCNVNMTGNLGVSAYFLQPGSGLQFSSMPPCRLVDTRQTGNPLQGGTAQNFAIPQLGNCAVPSTATAYSLNVTVVPHVGLGYLTIWPAGLAQPTISTMNSLDGRIKANAAIVPAGASGAISAFASNTTDLVLDIDGYFEPASGQTLQFYSLKPCRVLDTRKTDGDLGGPYLQSGQERDFPVLESNCQIPNTAKAYSMNFTAVPYNGELMGYLTVWAQGSSKPMVSTLNNLTATIVANAAIVPAGTGGGIAVYPSGNTQLVADIDGYFAPPGQGWSFTLSRASVPGDRHAQGEWLFQRRPNGGCGGQRLRSAGYRASLRLECDGGSDWFTRLSDLVARYRKPATSLDAECR